MVQLSWWMSEYNQQNDIQFKPLHWPLHWTHSLILLIHSFISMIIYFNLQFIWFTFYRSTFDSMLCLFWHYSFAYIFCCVYFLLCFVISMIFESNYYHLLFGLPLSLLYDRIKLKTGGFLVTNSNRISIFCVINNLVWVLWVDIVILVRCYSSALSQ